MKKSLFTVICLIMMCLLVNGVVAYAEDAVCYIGDNTETTYTSLNTAMYAANGKTIHLLADATLEATTNLGTSGGYVVDGTGENGENYTITLAGEVAVVNEHSGKLTNVNVDMGGYRFDIKGSTKFTLGSGTVVENGGGSDGGTAIVRSGATLNIEDGCIIRNSTASANGGALHVRGFVNMTGGSIENCKSANRGGAIALYEDGVMRISGNATITGNISTAKGETNIEVRDTDSLILADDFTGTVGITFDGCGEGKAFGIAEAGVTGAGNFVYDEDSTLKGAALGEVLFFEGDEELCCYLASHTDGATTYLGAYSVLKDALTAANGNTVHLAKDVSFPSGNLGTSGYVIDGEGYTITFTGDVTLLNEAGAVFKNVTVDLNEKHIAVTVNNGTTSVLTLGDGAHFKNGKGSNGGAALLNSGVVLNMEPGSMISDCTATGNGGTVHVNGGTFNMKGGIITGGTTANRGGGILVVEAGTLNLSGDATVTGNTSSYGVRGPVNNIEIRDFDSLNIAEDFLGEVGISYYDNTTFVAEADSAFGTAAAGVTIEKIENIKADKADVYAYIDGTSLKWTSLPSFAVEADSGIYSDKTGVIRFLTTFESVAPAAVASYGTYALATDEFDIENDASALTKFCDFDVAPENGKAYIVDVVEIPENKTETLISGVSFVKFKGVETPCYVPYAECISVMSCNETVKNLGAKVVSGN